MMLHAIFDGNDGNRTMDDFLVVLIVHILRTVRKVSEFFVTPVDLIIRTYPPTTAEKPLYCTS